MIKVEVSNEEKKIEKYPYIGKHPCGMIALFTSSRCGTILVSHQNDRQMGMYRNDFSEDAFKKFDSPVILINE